MGFFKREGLLGRVILGVLASAVTIIFFSLDQIEGFQAMQKTNSAFNYSMIIVMFYILFVMNIIAGIKEEYEVSITYIAAMLVYDLATDGLVTILFAGLSFISLVMGIGANRILRAVGIIED